MKNVHFRCTENEIEEFFQDCGKVLKVTIRKDKMTNQPLGYVYVEFETVDGANNAIQMNDTLLRGRLVTVSPKRKNIPGRGRQKPGNPMMRMMQTLMGQMSRGMRGGRGGGFRGRGGPRGGFRGGAQNVHAVQAPQ